MARAKFKRIHRTGRLTSQQAARDREIRRKVMEEYPPLEGAPVSFLLSDPLCEAIDASRKSVRRLAKEAKVSEVVLRQFLNGERDLRLTTAERLAQILDLMLVPT